MTHQQQNRFISNNLPMNQQANHYSISDYEDLPLLPLEEAVKEIIQLIPHIMDYVATAKENHEQHSTLLTPDESAAIYLYTMSKKEFFSSLNSALRDPNRQKLKPWLSFVKILITALKKLPSTKAIISRGVAYDATSELIEDEIYTYWNISSCTKDLSASEMYVPKGGSLLFIEAIHGKDISMFSAVPDEQEVILMPGTRVRAKCRTSNLLQSFFIIHLEEINFETASTSESNYFREQIKQKYQRNNRIERFVDPSKSLPIEQSYINLAIVEAKEVQKKEKELRDAPHTIAALNTFEEIYGIKTVIDVKDIFATCKNHEKQVLVFGRAGIGKSTFCRYIAYQWATGLYWPQYELLALIPLRCLTADRYPPGKSYSLLDLVKQEAFFDLTRKEEELLRQQFDPKKTLWILDGYDEIVQSVPPHLQCLFEQLLKTPHHILTSRPYLNTLSYDVKMEITGFTDDNIEKYVQRFFDQMKDELDDTIAKRQGLLKLLKSNHNIWGIAHIPVNLELICSLWITEDWSDTEQLTITMLYTRMTEWLCRRYLIKDENQSLQLSKDEINQRCQKELTFLETLAFNAMESNMIIIQPTILKKASEQLSGSFKEYLHILNMGILKSVNKPGINNRIETEKDHYFIHLSFQEYFAARYLINAVKGPQTEQAIECIKSQKYNQRYTLMFTFAAGLLSESNAKPYLNLFWDHILGEPADLVGTRHMRLVILFLEQTSDKTSFLRYSEFLQWIAQHIRYNFIHEDRPTDRHLLQTLQAAPSVASHPIIVNELITSLQSNNRKIREAALSFICDLRILDPSILLISSVMNTMDDKDENIRRNACFVLGKMGEKAATNEVITKLVSALGDQSDEVRRSACFILGNMGGKGATHEVITKLVSALGDQSDGVRMNACKALGNMGEKAATNEVITKLVSALGDQSDSVRMNACKALGNMGEKAATNEVITKLVSALGDQSDDVRCAACFTLRNMGEKGATNEVITKLVSSLVDQSEYVRSTACFTLGTMGEKAATDEVITKLVSALGDQSEYVRSTACFTLGEMGEKAATNEVITKLANSLGDQSDGVRMSACVALGKMGEKAATNEVITKLVSALEDQSEYVRKSAYFALGKMGEKAATNEVTTKLLSALGDQNEYVRSTACVVLGKMGEKAATNEVFTKLVSALGDQSEYVRSSACFVLGEMGEKAVTNEVIIKLVSALGDQSDEVRMNACKALGNMGEKAATNEVITKLLSALGDESWMVRTKACFVLGKMGVKAATNEVITKLVSALGDQSDGVRRNACFALGEMGEKAATNEVITKIITEMDTYWGYSDEDRARIIGNILTSSTVMLQLAPKTIADLCLCEYAQDCVKNISEEAVISAYLITRNFSWLPVVIWLTALKGTAVTVTENKIMLYGQKEPIELLISDSVLRAGLVDSFLQQRNRLHLSL